MRRKRTLFFPAKNKRLSKAISITSPTAFRLSIRRVKRMRGVSPGTKVKALVLAQNRAKAMLKRKRLSARERKQLRTIAKINIPKFKGGEIVRKKRRRRVLKILKRQTGKRKSISAKIVNYWQLNILSLPKDFSRLQLAIFV